MANAEAMRNLVRAIVVETTETRSVKPPPTFSGKDEDWGYWSTVFEAFGSAQGIEAELKQQPTSNRKR